MSKTRSFLGFAIYVFFFLKTVSNIFLGGPFLRNHWSQIRSAISPLKCDPRKTCHQLWHVLALCLSRKNASFPPPFPQDFRGENCRVLLERKEGRRHLSKLIFISPPPPPPPKPGKAPNPSQNSAFYTLHTFWYQGGKIPTEKEGRLSKIAKQISSKHSLFSFLIIRTIRTFISIFWVYFCLFGGWNVLRKQKWMNGKILEIPLGTF